MTFSLSPSRRPPPSRPGFRLKPRCRAIRRLSVAEMAAALESEIETRKVPFTGPKTVPAKTMKRMADMSGKIVMQCSSSAYAGTATHPSLLTAATTSTNSAKELSLVRG